MYNYEEELIKNLSKFKALPNGVLYINKESRVVVMKNADIIELRFIRPDNTFTTVQSKISISNPLNLLSDYANSISIVTGMVLDPQNIVILGAGGSVLMSYFHNFYPNSKVTGVDINKEVIEIAKNYFGFIADNNFHLIESDGIKYIKELDGEIDILVLDIFTNTGQPLPFTTQEFYKLCESKLSTTGIFCLNVHPAFLSVTLENLKSSFNCILEMKTPDSTTVFCLKNKTINLNEIKKRILQSKSKGDSYTFISNKLNNLFEVE